MNLLGSFISYRGLHPRGLIAKAGIAILLLPLAGGAQDSPSPPNVRVELLTDPETSSGSSPSVGIHFQLEPGWHIYWQNPGDSGEPPRIEWQLPRGYRAGPIEWPFPQRLEHGGLVDYGYEGDVLLMQKISMPPMAGVVRPVLVSVQVKWLVCREICIPGKIHLETSFPPVSDPSPEAAVSHKLFAAARKRLPQQPPPGAVVTATSEKDRWVLRLRLARKESHAIFFPLEPGEIEDAAPQAVTRVPRGLAISLKKSSEPLKPVESLRGVLVFPSGTAYQVDAPVRGSPRE